jgi:hypothetical protein
MLVRLLRNFIPLNERVPEDTDVFHVLARKPSLPEWIATKSFVYQIQPDGSIKYVISPVVSRA